MILASYIRTSGDKFGSTSLETQLEKIKAKCLVDGHTISGDFSDKESAETVKKRPGFQHALAHIRAGNADGLIVYKLDRFARSVSDGVSLLNEFKETGKALVCVADPIDTTSPLGEAFFQIAMVFAELERKTIAERCIQGRDARAAQLRYAGGAPPFGYKAIARDGRRELVEDEREQEVINEVFRLHSLGASYYAITQSLNARGITAKHGGKWYASSTKKLITEVSELTNWVLSGQTYDYLSEPARKTSGKLRLVR
jgi:DNA invertase Pin-like site-specific DNA recombinase